MDRQHTFGGLGLMGRLVDFDPDDGLGGGLVADAGLDDTGAALEADPGIADVTPPADAPAGFTLTQEMWDEMQAGTTRATGFVDEVMQALELEQQTQQQQQENARLAGLDWTDPNTALSEIDKRAGALAERMLEEKLGPYQHILDSVAQERGEKMVHEALDALVGEIGEFDKNQALILSNSFLANGVAPEQAFRQAAMLQQAQEERIRDEAVKAYVDRMRAAGDAPAELGSGHVAREGNELPYDPRSPDKYEALAQDWARRQQAKRAANSSVIG